MVDDYTQPYVVIQSIIYGIRNPNTIHYRTENK